MADDTAALIVALSAQISKFEKDMQKAAKVAETRTKEIETTFTKTNGIIAGKLKDLANTAAGELGTIGSIMRTIGPAGIAAAVGIGGLVLGLEAVKERIKALRELASFTKESADAARLSTSQFQAFAAILEKHGGSADDAVGALTKLNLAHAAATKGAGELYPILRQVGAAFAEEFAEATTGAQKLDAFNRALAAATPSQRDLLLRAGLGRSGVRFESTLKEVADRGGIEELSKSLLDVKRILEPGVVEALDAAAQKSREKTAEIKNNWDAVALSIDGARKRFIEWLGVSSKDSERGFISKKAREAADYLFPKPAMTPPAPATAATPVVPQQEAATVKQSADAIADYNAKLNDLSDAREKAIARADAYSKAEQAEADPAKADVLNRKAIEAHNEAEQKLADMGRLKAGRENLAKVEKEAAEAAPASLKLTVTPAQDTEKEINRLSRWIELEQKRLAVLGESAGVERRLQFERAKTRLEAIQKDPKITADEAATIDKATEARLRGAEITQRAQLGVATETERRLQFERELEVLGPRLGLSDAQRAQALALYNKELRETVEREQVRASNLPQLTQFSLDAKNSFKQFDQVAVRSLDSFGDAVADAALGTKTLSQAFSDMANSILRDIIKMSIKQGITGPLVAALFGGTGGVTTGGGLGGLLGGLFGRGGGAGFGAGAGFGGAPMNIVPGAGYAEGGTIPAYGKGIFAEHSPGGPKVVQAGAQPLMITPRDVMVSGGSGNQPAGPMISIHVAGEVSQASVDRVHRMAVQTAQQLNRLGSSVRSAQYGQMTGVSYGG